VRVVAVVFGHVVPEKEAKKKKNMGGPPPEKKRKMSGLAFENRCPQADYATMSKVVRRSENMAFLQQSAPTCLTSEQSTRNNQA
jgi:hypothetical protein